MSDTETCLDWVKTEGNFVTSFIGPNGREYTIDVFDAGLHTHPTAFLKSASTVMSDEEFKEFFKLDNGTYFVELKDKQYDSHITGYGKSAEVFNIMIAAIVNLGKK